MRTPNEIKLDEITARQNRRNKIVGTTIGVILFVAIYGVIFLILI